MSDKVRRAVPPPDPQDRFGWGPDDIKIEPPKPRVPKRRRKKKSDVAD